MSKIYKCGQLNCKKHPSLNQRPTTTYNFSTVVNYFLIKEGCTRTKLMFSLILTE